MGVLCTLLCALRQEALPSADRERPGLAERCYQSRHRNDESSPERGGFTLDVVEATTGIEPVYAVLQTAP